MKLLMAANWKMHKTRQEAASTIQELSALLDPLPEDRECVVFAPFTALGAAMQAREKDGSRLVSLGGQDCYTENAGAYTGEISPSMLKDCGCEFVLAGHSERRAVIGESDALVGAKTAFALKNGLKTVLCIGESLQERDSGALEEVLLRQLSAGLKDVPDSIGEEELSIAYEPVWAIGTGRVAGSKEIEEAHGLVRTFLKMRFPKQGRSMRILYGGSVKPDNAHAIIGLENVNGVLVGGASLEAAGFSRIVLA